MKRNLITFFLKGIVKSITEKIGFGNVKFKAKPVLTDNLSRRRNNLFYQEI